MQLHKLQCTLQLSNCIWGISTNPPECLYGHFGHAPTPHLPPSHTWVGAHSHTTCHTMHPHAALLSKQPHCSPVPVWSQHPALGFVYDPGSIVLCANNRPPPPTCWIHGS